MNRAASYARESDLYPQSRVVYRVVRLHEDSLQLPRPTPAVQQQARPLRVTTACTHIYGFKQAQHFWDSIPKGLTCCFFCPPVVSLPVPTYALQKSRAYALHIEERAMTNDDNECYCLLSRPPGPFKGPLGVNPKLLR